MLPETVLALEPGDKVIFNAQGGGFANLAPTKMLLRSGTEAEVVGRTELPMPVENPLLGGKMAIQKVKHIALDFGGSILFGFTYKEMETGFDLSNKKV